MVSYLVKEEYLMPAGADVGNTEIPGPRWAEALWLTRTR